MSDFYSDQDNNTTAVYLNGMRIEQFDDNDYLPEKEAIARHRAAGRVFVERVIFGNGRVALCFRVNR